MLQVNCIRYFCIINKKEYPLFFLLSVKKQRPTNSGVTILLELAAKNLRIRIQLIKNWWLLVLLKETVSAFYPVASRECCQEGEFSKKSQQISKFIKYIKIITTMLITNIKSPFFFCQLGQYIGDKILISWWVYSSANSVRRHL